MPRPFHAAAHPVHVTVKAAQRAGSLRRSRVAQAMIERLRVVANAPRFTQRRRTFRVIQFSIQPDHVHLIVEATSTRALSRGMQGLLGPLAGVVNRTLGRKGRLFVDRYHARDLATPREVRNALRYVLRNCAKHPEPRPDFGTIAQSGLDPCSSAWWFTGWTEAPPATDRPAPVAAPRTWLLTIGWRKHGTIDRHERPAAPTS